MPSQRPTELVKGAFIDGSRFNPYILKWPLRYYVQFGSEVGFPSDPEEIRSLVNGSGVLGLYRYQPAEGTLVDLSIPYGAYVCCRLRNQRTGGSD